MRGREPVFFSKASILAGDALGSRVPAQLLAVDAGNRLERCGVAAEHLFQRQRDLADCRMGTCRANRKLQQIAVAARGFRERVERLVNGCDVARPFSICSLESWRARTSALSILRTSTSMSCSGAQTLTPTSICSPESMRCLCARRGLLDARLGNALLNRGRHAAQRFSTSSMWLMARRRDRASAVRHRPSLPRVDDPPRAGLLLQDELRVARYARRVIGRKRQGLVEGVGVQRLCVPLRGCHRLDHGAGVDTVHLHESCAVSDQPEVWQCVRSDSERAGLLAKSSWNN